MAVTSVTNTTTPAATATTTKPITGALTPESKEYLDKIDNVNKTSGLKQNQDLGRDQFLHILLTQLSNQNPLDPLQDKDFIAQMAQFSSLESMQTLNKNFEGLKTDVAAMKLLMQGTGTTGTQQGKDLAAINTAVTQQNVALNAMNTTLSDLRELQIKQLNLLISQAQAAATYE